MNFPIRHFFVLCVILEFLSTQSDCQTFNKILYSTGYSNMNWVISPASIRSALEQLYIGSRGETKQQLEKALNITNYDDVVAEQTKLAASTGEGLTWKTANQIIVRDKYPLIASYKSKISAVFHTDVISSDFQHPQQLADSVNSWVSQHTDGFIKHLVDSDSLSVDLTMVILNAVYFKGSWKHGFKADNTAKRCFRSQPSDCQQIDMMKQTNEFSYGYFNDIKSQVIQLPYNGSNTESSFSMVVVLPRSEDGLSWVVENLTDDILLSKIDSLSPLQVDLTIPKFKTTFKINLNEPLKMMNLTSLFTGADFSGISNQTRLFVSQVLHKADIDVEETGTIATASTVMLSHGPPHPGPPPPPPVVFLADHPFLYYIIMNREILFTGQYTGK